MSRVRVILMLTTLAALAGCVETRVIEERGVITLRDLQPGGLRPVRADQPDQTTGGFESVLMPPHLPGTPVDDNPLRRALPDRSVRLFSFAPRHVINNLQDAIRNKETDLIDRYLISQSLKDLYAAEGRDPHQIARFIMENDEEVLRLLKLLPLGENTPGATFQDIGRNRFRLAPLGADMLQLQFTAIQLTIENREFRLLMLE